MAAIAFLARTDELEHIVAIGEHGGAELGIHGAAAVGQTLGQQTGKGRPVADDHEINILACFTQQPVAHIAAHHIDRHAGAVGQIADKRK